MMFGVSGLVMRVLDTKKNKKSGVRHVICAHMRGGYQGHV